MAALLKLAPEQTAFFICDLQGRLSPAIWNGSAVIHTATRMIRMAELFKIPVVITEQNPKALLGTVPEVMEKFSELSEDLKHGPFPKKTFSMLVPEVQDVLGSRKIQSVVLLGWETHVCVSQTALGLLRQGISVHVLADGVASCNREEIPIALARLGNAGAHVTSSEAALFELMDDAADEKFKAFATILKDEKPKITQSLVSLLSKN